MCRYYFVLTAFLAVGIAIGCSGKDKSGRASGPESIQSAATASGHLSRAQAKRLFPATLSGFAQSSFKIKEKSDEWQEYKGEYLRGQTVLKLVINDWLPKGNPEWEELMAEGSESVGGYRGLLKAKGNKVTLMVQVAERFRVDFKSRTMSGDQLREVAKAFDFSKVKRAAQ